MFSTYALQGIESKTKGVYTREELAPLAQTNVESLKEFGFFTFAKADGKRKILEPVDYFLNKRTARWCCISRCRSRRRSRPGNWRSKCSTRALCRLFVAEAGPDPSGRRAGGLQLCDPAPNDGAAGAQKLNEQTFMNGENSNYGADVRQQDHGGLPVSRPTSFRGAASSREPGIQTIAPVSGFRLRAAQASRNDGRNLVPLIGLILVAAICLDGAVHAALAQSPSVPARRAGRAGRGIVAGCWQSNPNFIAKCPPTNPRREIRCSAVWSLLAISFAYGIFHAAGPATARR